MTHSNDTFIKDLIDKLSNEKFVINDDGLKRFCELSVNALNKYYLARKNILEEIICHFLQTNFLKKSRLVPDFIIDT